MNEEISAPVNVQFQSAFASPKTERTLVEFVVNIFLYTSTPLTDQESSIKGEDRLWWPARTTAAKKATTVRITYSFQKWSQDFSIPFALHQ